jgi:hypothetical protein
MGILTVPLRKGERACERRLAFAAAVSVSEKAIGNNPANAVGCKNRFGNVPQPKVSTATPSTDLCSMADVVKRLWSTSRITSERLCA